MMNDKHILSSERGINSPQKNWFYLNLTLKVKRKKKQQKKETQKFILKVPYTKYIS